MSVPNKTNPYFFSGVAPYHDIAVGLEDFVKIVSRDFFAETKLLFRYSEERQKMELILDICCNFGLTVGLHHFNNENWGGFQRKEDRIVKSSFLNAFQNLNERNNETLELVEVSLNFIDTSIIVTQLYAQSIPELLGQIISKISEHFVYFTKGLTAMPYEIFVPVFEDTLPDLPGADKQQNSYFDYWGLYFEEGPKHLVMVYSLKNKQFCKEDLFLLE